MFLSLSTLMCLRAGRRGEGQEDAVGGEGDLRVAAS
jgi:hypothetical protein